MSSFSLPAASKPAGAVVLQPEDIDVVGCVQIQGTIPLGEGGKVRGSFHTLISECPSAKDKVAARL